MGVCKKETELKQSIIDYHIGIRDRDLNDLSSRSICICNEIGGGSKICGRYPLTGGRRYGIF